MCEVVQFKLGFYVLWDFDGECLLFGLGEIARYYKGEASSKTCPIDLLDKVVSFSCESTTEDPISAYTAP